MICDVWVINPVLFIVINQLFTYLCLTAQIGGMSIAKYCKVVKKTNYKLLLDGNLMQINALYFASMIS